MSILLRTSFSLLIVVIAYTPCYAAPIVYDYKFATGTQGWTAGFADYPAGGEVFYELQSGLLPLPANLGGANALYISGNNHSDDLFMYFSNSITGLTPGKKYEVSFELSFASQYADGSVGIGGSPGNSVFVKAGASTQKPESITVNGEVQFNLDKGNQGVGGTQGVLLGDIAKPDDGTDAYETIFRDNLGNPLSVTVGSDGVLWLFFGTDSGFEGITSLYYSGATVTLNQVDTAIPEPATWLLFGLGGLPWFRRKWHT